MGILSCKNVFNGPYGFTMVHIDLSLFNVFIALGGFLPPEEVKERFDSNCITPVSNLALHPAIARG